MISFLRRLWHFARPYQTRLFLGLGFGVLYALTNGALVIMVKLVVNVIFNSEQFSLADHLKRVPGFLRPMAESFLDWLPALKSPSSRLGVVLVICSIPLVALLRGLFAYLNIYLMYWAAIRTVADLRTKLFDHLQNLSLGFFSSARPGDLISRITNDTQVLHAIIGNTVSSIIKDPVTVVCMLALLLSQEPRLTLISIIVLPACLLPMIIYGRKIRHSATLIQTHSADLASVMHESFTGNRIIKAYNLEDAMLKEFQATTGKNVSHMMRVLRANEIPGQSMEFLGALGVSLVFLYLKFFSKAQTPGDFVGFVFAVFLMYQPIKSLTKLRNQLEQARAASHRVFELLDSVSAIKDPPSPLPLQAAGAEIQFQNIDFAYNESQVLRGINLKVEPGQLVALVGSSGSGKTTLTNLLLRFYDPQRGAVRIGGTDIREVSLKELRRQVALVAQETILFNDTVRRNIAAGRPDASDAEIEAAAKHAHAHNFIIETPQGYDTVVGEKGANLSMGQRQRLTIARAVLKNAPILILDEATSALDNESERAVQAALEELMENRTTICIAHRLSTIQKADRIVVLNRGQIVETGSHDELILARGAYYKLYELQFESALGVNRPVAADV